MRHGRCWTQAMGMDSGMGSRADSLLALQAPGTGPHNSGPTCWGTCRRRWLPSRPAGIPAVVLLQPLVGTTTAAPKHPRGTMRPALPDLTLDFFPASQDQVMHLWVKPNLTDPTRQHHSQSSHQVRTRLLHHAGGKAEKAGNILVTPLLLSQSRSLSHEQQGHLPCRVHWIPNSGLVLFT